MCVCTRASLLKRTAETYPISLTNVITEKNIRKKKKKDLTANSTVASHEDPERKMVSSRHRPRPACGGDTEGQRPRSRLTGGASARRTHWAVRGARLWCSPSASRDRGTRRKLKAGA